MQFIALTFLHSSSNRQYVPTFAARVFSEDEYSIQLRYFHLNESEEHFFWVGMNGDILCKEGTTLEHTKE